MVKIWRKQQRTEKKGGKPKDPECEGDSVWEQRDTSSRLVLSGVVYYFFLKIMNQIVHSWLILFTWHTFREGRCSWAPCSPTLAGAHVLSSAMSLLWDPEKETYYIRLSFTLCRTWTQIKPIKKYFGLLAVIVVLGRKGLTAYLNSGYKSACASQCHKEPPHPDWLALPSLPVPWFRESSLSLEISVTLREWLEDRGWISFISTSSLYIDWYLVGTQLP